MTYFSWSGPSNPADSVLSVYCSLLFQPPPVTLPPRMARGRGRGARGRGRRGSRRGRGRSRRGITPEDDDGGSDSESWQEPAGGAGGAGAGGTATKIVVESILGWRYPLSDKERVAEQVCACAARRHARTFYGHPASVWVNSTVVVPLPD